MLNVNGMQVLCGEKRYDETSWATPPRGKVRAGAFVVRGPAPSLGASLSGRTVILIFVCASSAPYVTGERVGISFKPLIARSNASTGGAKAIGPVDWAIFSDSSGAVDRRTPDGCAEKCGRSAAAAPKQEKPLNRRIQVAYYRTARP